VFFAKKRVSPYAVVGTGRGVERPNVNEFFQHGVDRKIVVIYYGAGARIPIHRRLMLAQLCNVKYSVGVSSAECRP
jgi:uncharacterized protein (UPF0248 family)